MKLNENKWTLMDFYKEIVLFLRRSSAVCLDRLPKRPKLACARRAVGPEPAARDKAANGLGLEEKSLLRAF